MSTLQFVLINFGALITALGGVFLKRLSSSAQNPALTSDFAFRIFLNPYLWAGGICYLLPVFLWGYLLRSMELTKLQPLLSIVYIYTIFLAYFFLGEQPTQLRLAGIVLIIFGVFLVGQT